jgi:hypothetical protein
MKRVLVLLLCLGCVTLCACAPAAPPPAAPAATAAPAAPVVSPAEPAPMALDGVEPAAEEEPEPSATETAAGEGEGTAALATASAQWLNPEVEVVLAELQTRCDELIAGQGVLPDKTVHQMLRLVRETATYLNENYFLSEFYWGDWDDWYEWYIFAVDQYPKWQEDKFISLRGDGEGGFGYGLNYSAIHAGLQGRLSEAYDKYLVLMAEYHSEYWAGDAALGIAWGEIAQYLIDWSAFKAKYTSFIEGDDIDENLRVALYVYSGCIIPDYYTIDSRVDPNSGEYKIMPDPYILSSYEQFLNNPANKACPYYEDIAALYKTWQDNQFEYTQDVKDFLDSLRAKLGEEPPWYLL